MIIVGGKCSIYNYNWQSIEYSPSVACAFSLTFFFSLHQRLARRRKEEGNICTKLDANLNWDEKGGTEGNACQYFAEKRRGSFWLAAAVTASEPYHPSSPSIICIAFCSLWGSQLIQLASITQPSTETRRARVTLKVRVRKGQFDWHICQCTVRTKTNLKAIELEAVWCAGHINHFSSCIPSSFVSFMEISPFGTFK